MSGICYESYLQSGNPNFQQIAQSLQIPPNKPFIQQTAINIAFGNFTFENDNGIVIGGVGVSMQELQDVINILHEKGYYVKMSFGGAGCNVSSLLQTQEDAIILAIMISEAIATYGFDGVDLDIEDWSVDPNLEVFMIAMIRELLGNERIISLTVPGDTFWYPVQTAIAGSIGFVDYFNFMEYGIDLENGNSFVEQVAQNVNAYLETYSLLPGQINLGFYPDNGDPTSYISIQELQQLVPTWADISNIMIRGTMLWSLVLDSEGNLGDETFPFEYTQVMTNPSSIPSQ
ncbi:MAG: glycoside hydrolase family 18 protein [Verrucomicrobia bacterium]|nr:glycoside hydrolase family 18 protein [Verrucomicrobiota bacterium]